MRKDKEIWQISEGKENITLQIFEYISYFKILHLRKNYEGKEVIRATFSKR